MGRRAGSVLRMGSLASGISDISCQILRGETKNTCRQVSM
jgi:hypothetical protein